MVYREHQLTPDLFDASPVLTIGNFDGIHRGHQRVLGRVRAAADERGTRAVAMTFEPHPVKFLNPKAGLRLIYPYRERLRLLAEYGMDDVIVWTFDEKLAVMPAEEFVSDVLVGLLQIQKIVVGYDFNFGRGGDGNATHLQEIACQRGYEFDVEQIGVHHVDGEVVSSSHIRQHLEIGNVDRVSRLLGRPFHLRGFVVAGKGRGQGLGFPTANLSVQQEIIPRDGVYLGRARVRDTVYDALINVGHNPTFGVNPVTVEAFLLDFDARIYDEEIDVLFLERLRDEMRFANGAELRAQMDDDLEAARDFFYRLHDGGE